MPTLSRSPFDAALFKAIARPVPPVVGLIAIASQLSGPIAFAELEPVSKFRDVTQEVGLGDLPDAMAQWGDYDGDGWVDLKAGSRVFRNHEGERFEEIDTPLPMLGIWVDLDNDGNLDYVSGQDGGRLFRGNGRGEFSAGSAMYDPKKARHPLVSVATADRGERLDLFVTNYENPVTPNWYFRTRPDGGYADPVNLLGEKGWASRGATWGDFDDDGDPDLYVANYRLMPNQLWVNQGEHRFEDQAEARGAIGQADGGEISTSPHHRAYRMYGHTIGANWGDLNNDGRLDLLVVNFSHKPAHQDRVEVLLNTGPPRYRFQNANADNAAGIYWQESYAKGAMGDYDNDGDLDAYITTVYTYAGDQGELFENDGAGHFTPVGEARGVRGSESYQAAWADYDNDGDLDLLTNGRLLENPGNDNRWLKVRVVGGDGSNRSAIGARVRVHTDARQQIREITAGESGNQQPLAAHFGLGKTSEPVRVDVRFPSGKIGRWEAEPGTTLIANETDAERGSASR